VPRIRPASVPVRARVGGSREIRRRRSVGVSRHRLGEPEVEHLDLAVRSQLDVGRLQVAVDDALLVRFLEGLGDLLRNDDRFVNRDCSALQPLREVLAGDELHRQEMGGRAVGESRALESVDVGDVGVIEGGQQLRLALEAGQALGILCHLGRQHLDRDLAPELVVGRAIHLAHASRAEGCGDSVVGEILADQGADYRPVVEGRAEVVEFTVQDLTGVCACDGARDPSCPVLAVWSATADNAAALARTSAGRSLAHTRRVFGRPEREGGLPLPPAPLPPASGWAWRSAAGSTSRDGRESRRYTASSSSASMSCCECGRLVFCGSMGPCARWSSGCCGSS